MFDSIYSNFKNGVKKVIGNPQLTYTIVVAILIVGAFVFMAERFIRIATDAQERLINVRIGSLQDAFVSFAKDKINEQEYLNQKISEIISTNETIRNFKIIQKERFSETNTDGSAFSYKIIASDNKDEINQTDKQISFLFNLATGDPAHSITIELQDNGERLFKTIRAITNQNGDILGAVVTTQTLSLADIAIQKNIRNTEILLIFITILVIFSFLRHSKIIDYMDLYKKLKEVDQLKDDFVSMASHELRTPLSVIRGYADFIREAPELSEETKNYVSKIDISTKDLDNLVADILDVSRMQQGKMSFNIVKINPKAIIEEVTSSFTLAAKEKDLNVLFNNEIQDEFFINIDVDRFKQILVNIIGNAVKYTQKGEVTVRLYKEKDSLFIRVSDTGIGMTEEEKAKLFQKFYRVRNKETENIRGTGLGLWITAQMIKQMGGKLSVESIKGVGSHFVVSFLLVE